MLKPRHGATDLAALATGGGLFLVAALSGMLGLAEFIGANRPAVGDILTFNTAGGVPDSLPGQLGVMRTDGSPCQLDLRAMRDAHGSMVVEAVTNTAPRAYRLHWAGTPTHRQAGDCGTSADIEASETVMATLLVAAGGAGLGPEKRELPVFVLQHMPQTAQ